MCVLNGGLGLGWCGRGFVGYAVPDTLPMYIWRRDRWSWMLVFFLCGVGSVVGFWRVVKAWWASRFSIGVGFPSGGLVVVVVWWLRFVAACTAFWWLDASVGISIPLFREEGVVDNVDSWLGVDHICGTGVKIL